MVPARQSNNRLPDFLQWFWHPRSARILHLLILPCTRKLRNRLLLEPNSYRKKRVRVLNMRVADFLTMCAILHQCHVKRYHPKQTWQEYLNQVRGAVIYKFYVMDRMPVANRDASQITIKNQQKAFYAWKSYNDAAVNLGVSVRQEQPSYQSNRVVVARQQGGCKCSNDASTNPYEFNGLSSCGCGM